MAEAIFPDTTVLCSFAAVHRLGLPEEFFRGRGRWVEAVAFEVDRSARHLRDLASVVTGGWMGQPIEIVSDRAVALVSICAGTCSVERPPTRSSTSVRDRRATC